MLKRNLIIAVIFTAVLLTVQTRAQEDAAPQSNVIFFRNQSPITINDNTTAAPYPSNITVSNVGVFTRLEVALVGFSHTFPDDVDIILVGPNGQRAVLMSDAGDNPDVTNLNLTFSQTATTPIPDATALTTGTFRPTNYQNNGNDFLDTFPAPGPGGLTNEPADLSVFYGNSADGVWSLYVVDDAGQDVGSISGGWTLFFTKPTIFTVNSTADTTDGICDATNCTLREAITAAQNGDLINFSTLFNTPQTINLLTDLPDINRSITIQGKGANLLTVRRDFNAATNFRIFRIFSAVAISGMTITGGDIGPAPSFGGGIYSEGLLSLTNVHLEGNAAGGGGGVYLSNADGVFTNCTFSNNRAGIQSGAIYFSGEGRILRIVNSTISGNTSGIANVSFSGNSRLEIVNSTIVSNLSGGIMTSALNSGSSATATLRNTIVTGNTTSNFSTGAQNGGTATFQTLGFNLSDNFNGVITPLANDIISATPRLAPLALYGGQTPTHALLHASPAINAGDASGATADQRGVDRVTGASADIGAVEMRPVVVNNVNNTGSFSLRNVIAATNSASDLDDILFDNTVFSTPQTITLTSGELLISNPVNIIAPGANLVTISGNNSSRVFQVSPNITATLSGLTITGGNANGDGGGIYNDGTLNVTHSSVSGNNSAFNGGGIGSGSGDITIIANSTISGNTAQAGGGAGGGIMNNGTLTVTNSTISGNTGEGGGGIYSQNGGTLNLTNSTITNNRSNAANSIGGINNVSGIANIRNSIIAGNVDNTAKPDVGGTGFASNGFNLIGNRGMLTFNQPGDQSGTSASPLNPLLGPLQNNGGTTFTHALLAGSPALDRGSSSGATSDQRGLTRPFDLSGITNISDGADIGAFEAQTAPVSLPTISITDVANSEGNSGTTTFTFTVLLSSSSSQAVTVSYQTANGTAGAGSDYNAVGATPLTFTAGETSKNVTVAVIGDTMSEQDETFFVNLSSPTNATIADGQGQATIFNDDACTYTFSPPSPQSVPAASSNLNVGVTTQTLCMVSASTNTPWITILPNSLNIGNPNVTVMMTFAANTGPARSGSVSIAGQTYTINQAAGSTTTVRAPFDFDGDGKTDISIFRPSVGQWWYLRSSDSGNRAFSFGNSSDKLAPGDYTGDGKTDIAFWRPSTGQWFILRSEDLTFFAFPFGTNGDIPVPADFDGDGRTDTAVFRPSNLTWYILKSSGGVDIIGFGAAGDKPVVADYDGDGKADIAIYRNNAGVSEWWIWRSLNNSVLALQFGSSTDKPVQGDYTGDGKADVAFWRPSTGQWFVLRSEDFSFFAFPYGLSGDTPVPGDYDGDGRFDPGVFRPTDLSWYILRSTGGNLIQQFGANGDVPTPAAFIP